MSHWRLIALLLALLGCPALAQAQAWPNEPAGSTLLLDCGFSSATCGGALYDVYNSAHTGTQSDAPLSPTSVLEMYLPGTQTSGGAQVGLAFGTVRTEIYWGTWFKINSLYEGKLDNTNKTIFTNNPPVHNMFWGFYGPQNATSWVWAVNLQNSGPLFVNTHLTSFDPWLFGNSCQIQRNTWYRLEAYQKASTNATSRDGILRWWVTPAGGAQKLCGDYTTVNMPGGFQAFEYNQTWDGSAPNFGTKTKDWYMWFDHGRVSAPNCAGTCGGGGTNTEIGNPPIAPTNLRISGIFNWLLHLVGWPTIIG